MSREEQTYLESSKLNKILWNFKHFKCITYYISIYNGEQTVKQKVVNISWEHLAVNVHSALSNQISNI